MAFFIPEQVKDQKREWVCRVAITRASGAATETAGRGVDALQSVVNAFGAVRYALKAELRDLTWLGDPGHIGIPRVVPDEDPDFLDLFEHLLLAERCRMLLVRKRMVREGKGSSRRKVQRKSKRAL